MSRAIFNFTTDFRFQDNTGLSYAIQNFDEVLPVYVFEEDPFKSNNKRQNLLIIQCLIDLNKQLEKTGKEILVKIGDPRQVLVDLFLEYEFDHLISSSCPYEDSQKLENYLSENLICTFLDGNTMVFPEDLAFNIDETPVDFKEFLQLYKDSTIRLPESISIPNYNFKIDNTDWEKILEEYNATAEDEILFKAGETIALSKLEEILFDKKTILRYSKNCDPYVSELEIQLSLGTISPRLIYKQLSEFESKVEKTRATKSLKTDIIKRDHKKFLHMNIFSNFQTKKYIQYPQDNQDFDNWITANTENKKINKRIKKLNAEGYLNCKESEEVMKFFTENYPNQWVYGASYFKEKMIAIDDSLNEVNWYLANKNE